MGNTRTLTYGKTRIEYSIQYKNRTTLAIEVHPDSSVHVKAPVGTGLDVLEARLLKRASWIVKQQRAFKSYAPALSKRLFVSGEGFRYLGKQYRLKLIEAQVSKVRLWQGRLEVHVPVVDDKASIEKLVEQWFRQRASTVFNGRYLECQKRVKPYGVTHAAGFDVRSMPKRWGSCTKNGKILLNPLLVSAPKPCIDYVITHELCHTKIHNHSSKFYALLSQCMPDWENKKQLLNNLVESISK